MSETTQNTELSKSKKKRMKRKAAKDRKEQEGNNKQGNAETLAALTPHEKLCHDLMQHGYVREVIEAALEEMWNIGLEYDSFSAALTYLQGREAQKKQAEAEKESATAAAAEAAEEKPASAPVPARAPTPPQDKWEKENNSQPKEEVTPSVSESSTPEPTVATALASKLDVVANFPVLYDAVFALAEWTTKAAKPSELRELCALGTSKPPAIYTIIGRCINCELDSEFRSLIPHIKTIIAVLIGKKRDDAACSSFTDVLSFVRDTVEQSRSHPMEGVDLSESAVHSFTTQICKSLELAREAVVRSETTTPVPQYNEEERSAVIQAMETEIDNLLAQQPTDGNGVVELMTRRDCRKVAAEKAATITKMLLEDQRDGGAHCANGNGDIAEAEKRLNADQLLTDLFNGHYPKFQRNRALFADLESRMSDSVQQRGRLQGQLEDCADEVRQVKSRKQALEAELSKINRELNNLTARQSQLQEGLEKLHNGKVSDGDGDGLKDEHRKRAQYIKVEDQLTSLVDRLASLEDILVPKAEPSLKISSNNRTERVLESLQTESKLENFFVLAKNYFSTEADCVDFMRNRVVGLEIEARERHREIAECSALGMATNVSKMTSALDTIRRNILEDQAVISALQGEAETMRDALIERTDNFTKVSAATMSLTPTQRGILGGIGAFLTRIGIDASNPLFTSVDSMIGVQTQTKPQQPIGRNNNEALKQNKVRQQQAPPPPQPAKEVPKFSWGGRASTKKNGSKSLVDIQKEELTKQENGVAN